MKIDDIPEGAPWPKMTTEVIDSLQKYYIDECGYNEDDALNQAQTIMLVISSNIGGLQFYVPMFNSLKQAMVRKKIYNQYKSQDKPDIQAIARQFECSEQTVYVAIREGRKASIAKRQLPLPFIDKKKA